MLDGRWLYVAAIPIALWILGRRTTRARRLVALVALAHVAVLANVALFPIPVDPVLVAAGRAAAAGSAGDGGVRLVPFDAEGAGLVLLVIDTKVSHSHAGGGYAARRASCELGADVLGVRALRDVGVEDLEEAAGLLDPETFRRVRHVVTENDRVLRTVELLEGAGPQAIGPLLDASHASMRDDFEISCAELDLAVDTARTAGAIGARMTGGGFGGCAIALAPADAEERLRAAVGSAFTGAGYAAPDIFRVRPAAGALRLA